MANTLIKAVLIKRYKRFLADVRLSDGTELTVHCPNTGAMTGCAEPGSTVWLSTSDNPKRKYAHTWELGQSLAGDFMCIHSAHANLLVAQALEQKLIPELIGYQYIQREYRLTDGSRIDFGLYANEVASNNGSEPECYVEVKSVTLALGEGLGAFPDAVSARARKHINSLMTLRAAGHRVILLFAVLHTGIKRVQAADHIDPAYAAVLNQAIKDGLEVLCYAAVITPEQSPAIRLSGQALPFCANT